MVAFNALIDLFRVSVNGTNIFLDNFNDGAPPPNLVNEVPGGSTFGGAYRMRGSITSETGGRAILDSANAVAGQPLGSDQTSTIVATLPSEITPGGTLGLRMNRDFNVFGRFDLGTLTDNQTQFSIRLSDVQTNESGTIIAGGDDTAILSVSKGYDGSMSVRLVDNDFLSGTKEVVGSAPLDLSADQIVLKLSHTAGTGEVTASIFYVTAGVLGPEIALPGIVKIFGTGTATTADDEDYTRAQFSVSGLEDTGATLIDGDENDNTLNGTAGDEDFVGYAGDDIMSGGGGNDTIDGRAGNDTAVFAGNRADYAVSEVDATHVLITGAEGSVIATNVENFQFADQTLSLDALIDPEIEVRGNDAIIADGDSIPSAADHTAFGTVLQGATLIRTFTINNLGTETLTIANLQVPGGFTLLPGSPTSIAPGGTATFQVQINTASPGTFSGQITFTTNDADETEYNFGISGQVIAPEIEVRGNNVVIVDNDTTPVAADHTDFGSAAVGASAIRTFTVFNNGDADLTISDLAVSTGFTILEGLSAVIAAGSSDTFQIQMDTATGGARTGTVSFTTNDADEGAFNFAIKGSVTTSPEVAVTGNGVDIADGNIAPDAADDTAFGTHLVNAVVERTFTVTNTGSANLTTSGLKLPAGFRLAPGEKLNPIIAPGQSDTFKVVLDTKKVGTYGGVISFKTNDTDEGTFDFAVSGAVVQPEIDVLGNGTSIKDGSKKALIANHTLFDAGIGLDDTPPVRTFTISNAAGAADLTISSAALVGAGFTLLTDLTNTVLQGGQSVTFDVAIDTAVAGTRSATIQINNNDANEALYDFVVTGSVGPRNVVGSDAVDDDFVATADPERFDGKTGSDTVSYDEAGAAVVASLLPAGAKKNAGFALGDLYVSIENLIGSASNDTLTGNDGDNVLEGGAGADKLDGGKGIDTASYAGAAGGVIASLLKAANGGEAAGDTYKNIENLLGSSFNDTLAGDTKVNALDGGDGNDTLIGNGGIDTLTGGSGADTFQFNAIKDGGGATKVQGVNPPPTGDLITDFVSGEDVIGIVRSGFKIAATLDEATFQTTDYFLSETGVAPTTANQTGVTATANGHGQFLFNQTTAQLWWDPDGSGKQAAVLLATFTNGAQLLATDFDLVV